MPHNPRQLNDDALDFLSERHLATLSSVRADGSPHVVPLGFSWDDDRQLARVIASAGSYKVSRARAGGRLALCQVDGRRWLTLEGTAEVSADPGRVAEAVARYTVRYRIPRPNPNRVVIEITVDRVLGSAALLRPHERPQAS